MSLYKILFLKQPEKCNNNGEHWEQESNPSKQLFISMFKC